ncbi:serine/threonine-protein kinase [Myxacorys almedinensis]|uniref:Protein kinase n=1 Tax=Myxacorys almedinensis A TaxID=2690445 RepID=A0A8J8CJ18_9CYAN|nr:serine/threonine-protein kinase [Myxacorys almedinensis]NDJ18199.1 protein kinase [Myxacorys almedinensis A]
MKLQTGATLQNGKYLLSQALGGDGVGATYLATQTLLNQGVVIKTLDPSLQITRSFPQLKERFIEEVRLLARTQHPSIVRVLDFFEEDQLPCLVMELISGRGLATLVSTTGALPEAEAIHYVRQAGSALSAAHAHGLIHRNIQPRSLICRQGTNLAVLVGFGFAHDLASASLPAAPANPFTPSWEVERAIAIDRYGLAATLYYLLSGQSPMAQMSLDQHPWSDTTKEAILLGMNPVMQSQPVEDWLRILPNTTLPLVGTSPAFEWTAPPRPAPSPPAIVGDGLPNVIERKAVEQDVPNRVEIGVERTVNRPLVPPPPPPPLKITQPTATLNGFSTPPPPSIVTQPLTQRPIATYTGMRRHFPKFLILTGASAIALGLGFGLALRISAAKAPGASIFHPAQTFRDRDWKGTLSPEVDLSDIPVEQAPGNYGSKPPITTDWTIPTNSLDTPASRLAPPEVDLSPEMEPTLPPRPETSPLPDPDVLDVAPPIEEPAYSPPELAPVRPIPAPLAPIDPLPIQPVAPEPPTNAPVPPANGASGSSQRDSAPDPPFN